MPPGAVLDSRSLPTMFLAKPVSAIFAVQSLLNKMLGLCVASLPAQPQALRGTNIWWSALVRPPSF